MSKSTGAGTTGPLRHGRGRVDPADLLETEKRAWDSALLLLAAAPRTVHELGRRLARTYPAPVVEAVLGRLEARGWLDDREFAAGYIRSHPDHGARRLLADLARKGVDRPVAARAVQEALGEVDASAQAREAAAKRLSRMSDVDRETAQRRLIGFLARRGYGPDVISRALAPLLSDLPRQERQQEKSFGRRSSSLSRRKSFRPAMEEEQET